MFLLLFIVLFFVVWGGYANSPAGRGKSGENQIRSLIGKTDPGYKYVINNLVLKTNNGRTCQIDHIVINKSGLFVIETKNYSGRIYGQENHQEWTQVLQYGKVKNKLYNPLKQNRSHVYHVSNAISCKVPIISAVVFTQGNTQYIDADGVYTPRGLKQLLSGGKKTLSPALMKKIYEELLSANQIDTPDSEHIRNIKRMKNDLAHNLCPRCGKRLTKRTGKNGAFWGCSGYPNCRFTKSIT